MSNEEIITNCTTKTVEIIMKNKIQFRRGDPYKYFYNISCVNYNLTLPICDKNNLSDAIILKNMCSLWTLIIDDFIDQDHSISELISSTLLLHGCNTDPIQSITQIILQEMLEPFKGNKLYDINWVDVKDILDGFYYENLINTYPNLSSSEEYKYYGTKAMIGDMRYYLNTDMLFSDNINLNSTEYSLLRLAYYHLSIALKYSSDIGSLNRELYEEKNLNIIIIKAIEENLLDINKFKSISNSESIINQLLPIINNVKVEISNQMNTVNKLLQMLPNIDISRFLTQVNQIIDNYNNSIDEFFKK
jgi:hypothetical protein